MPSHLGELAALGAALIWAFTMCLFRRFGDGCSAIILNLFKNIVALTCFLMALLMHPVSWPTDHSLTLQLAFSGFVGIAIGDSFLMAALPRLGAQLTAASQCLCPPIASLIAFCFINETLSFYEFVGMMVTVVAVGLGVFFTQQGDVSGNRRQISQGIAFALVSAITNALGIVIARNAMPQVDVILGGTLRIGPAVLLLPIGLWQARKNLDGVGSVFKPHSRWLGLTAGAIFGGFVGILLMSFSSKFAKAGLTAALSNTYPLWIMPIAVFFLKERCEWRTVACTLAAIAGIILMLYQ